MRILFLSQLLPCPLDAGPKIRAHYVLQYLAEAGHDVTLVSFLRPGDRPADLRATQRLCRGLETVPLARSRKRDVVDGMRSLASNQPFLVLRDRIPAMDALVRRLLAERSFDAVHADQLWMAAAASVADGPLTVLDQHNAVFLVPERLAAGSANPLARGLFRREARALAEYERATVRRFDHVVWVSRHDRDAVGAERSGPDAVIPIAVDTRALKPVTPVDPFRVTFVGGLHWPPNAEGVRWCLEAVWPRVAAAVPAAQLTIIGRPPSWSSRRPMSMPRCTFTGYLDERDLVTHLAQTAAFIVPLQSGAGMRVKILDAWARALPVVSTRVGAEGVAAVDGENALIADSAEAFADRIIRLLRDRAWARRIGDGGRATVEAHYDWRRLYPAWDQVYH